MAQYILNGLFAIAALVAILDYFGVKPTKPSERGIMPLDRGWKLAIMLVLVAASLGMSVYGSYRSLHPKIVEKTVTIEKPVEKIIEKDCPKPATIKRPVDEKPASKPKVLVPVQSQVQSGHDNSQAGPITQGPCSNLQVSGSNNQATTNCIPDAQLASWKQEPLPVDASGHPGVRATFAVSHGWTNIRIAARCTVPCAGVSAIAPMGFLDSGQATSTNPTIVAVEIGGPVLEAHYPVQWEIRSKDNQPVSLLRMWLVSTRPPQP